MTTTTTTRDFRAIQCPTPTYALRSARRIGGKAITYQGRNLVAGRALLAALEASRQPFAYLGEHAGRVVTIPVH